MRLTITSPLFLCSRRYSNQNAFLRLSFLARQPLFQLVQCLSPMANLVLLALFHLSIRLAFVLEARVPTFTSSALRTPSQALPHFRHNNEKICHLPKTVGPRLSTNLPSVRPWKRIASWPGPSQYPNVHTAWADLSSKPESILWRLGAPRESMNHLLADQGR